MKSGLHAFVYVFSACLAACCSLTTRAHAGDGQSAQRVSYAIVIHGGCGSADRLLPQDVQEKYRKSLRSALTLGTQQLRDGGSALDVVERVARAMEDDGNFNAGKGSVFNCEGHHELDASIMDGRNMACGAVAGVRTIKNPISLARRVMERSDHVLLAGQGAEQFATAMEVARVEPAYFYTPRLKKLWETYQTENESQISQLDLGVSRGTIGVVAYDTHGDLAAATSTGGMCYKMPGRVGDSPIIGAGTYARNGVCAVSCTGRGEEFIRHSVAHTVAALVRYRQLTVDDAVKEVIDNELSEGAGGIIAVGADGSISARFNTQAMLHGAADSQGRFEVGIWAGDGER